MLRGKKVEFAHHKYLKHFQKKTRKFVFVEKFFVWTSAIFDVSGRQIKKGDKNVGENHKIKLKTCDTKKLKKV